MHARSRALLTALATLALAAPLVPTPALAVAQLTVTPSVAIAGWPTSDAPNDPFYRDQQNLATLGVPAAWRQAGTGAASVTVAVLDTGIDASNPDFAGRLAGGYNAYTGQATSGDDYSAVADGNGHGTATASEIVADADNAFGIAGIAPGVRLLAVKVQHNSGYGDLAAEVLGLDWAVAHGARVVSMSFGGPIEAADVPRLQTAFATAAQQGVVLVAAAGNNGREQANAPCVFSGVICVGSSDLAGTRVSSFSTRSDAVALVAPGERDPVDWLNEATMLIDGTSAATPEVAAAAALLLSTYPALTPDQVRTALVASVRPLAGTGPASGSGAGLLDIPAALARAATLVGTDAAPSGASSAAAPIAVVPSSLADGQPVTVLTEPESGATDVARDAAVSVTAPGALLDVGSASLTLSAADGTSVPGQLSVDAANTSAVLRPAALLIAGQTYTATFGGLRTAAGLPVTSLRWSFTITADATAPSVAPLAPASGAQGVSRWPTLTARFSEPVVDANLSTVTLQDAVSRQAIPLAVSLAGTTLLIRPRIGLAAHHAYRVLVGGAIRDVAGNPLAATSWSFRTGRSGPSLGQVT